MSDDGFSIRPAGASRPAPLAPDATVAAEDARRVVSASPGARMLPSGFVETAEALPSELGGNVDQRLFERMNSILVSPAMSSMTHRVNVLHSVVSWLEAQAMRFSGDGTEQEMASAPPTLPWLGAVIDTLNEEISFIEAFHQGTLRDVEGQVD